MEKREVLPKSTRDNSTFDIEVFIKTQRAVAELLNVSPNSQIALLAQTFRQKSRNKNLGEESIENFFGESQVSIIESWFKEEITKLGMNMGAIRHSTVSHMKSIDTSEHSSPISLTNFSSDTHSANGRGLKLFDTLDLFYIAEKISKSRTNKEREYYELKAIERIARGVATYPWSREFGYLHSSTPRNAIRQQTLVCLGKANLILSLLLAIFPKTRIRLLTDIVRQGAHPNLLVSLKGGRIYAIDPSSTLPTSFLGEDKKILTKAMQKQSRWITCSGEHGYISFPDKDVFLGLTGLYLNNLAGDFAIKQEYDVSEYLWKLALSYRSSLVPALINLFHLYYKQGDKRNALLVLDNILIYDEKCNLGEWHKFKSSIQKKPGI